MIHIHLSNIYRVLFTCSLEWLLNESNCKCLLMINLLRQRWRMCKKEWKKYCYIAHDDLRKNRLPSGLMIDCYSSYMYFNCDHNNNLTSNGGICADSNCNLLLDCVYERDSSHMTRSENQQLGKTHYAYITYMIPHETVTWRCICCMIIILREVKQRLLTVSHALTRTLDCLACGCILSTWEMTIALDDISQTENSICAFPASFFLSLFNQSLHQQCNQFEL